MVQSCQQTPIDKKSPSLSAEGFGPSVIKGSAEIQQYQWFASSKQGFHLKNNHKTKATVSFNAVALAFGRIVKGKFSDIRIS